MDIFREILRHFLLGDIDSERILSGSERSFFRVRFEGTCCVVLIDKTIGEIRRYETLLRSLLNMGIPVPKVYATDDDSCAMAMEDIGSLSLFDWYRSTGDIEPHLRAASLLARIHALPNLLGQFNISFENTDFLFETQYFLRHFLIGFCGFDESIGDMLEPEFLFLAQKAIASPRSFMHRDYQSQNIFICHGDIKIVDFQGARYGFAAYDVASLIEDPYLSMPESEKNMIFNEYTLSTALSQSEKRMFIKAYPYISIQRLLQATAAFAYLSKNQKKDWFKRFIIPSLEAIQNWCEYTNEFPMLGSIIAEARSQMRFPQEF